MQGDSQGASQSKGMLRTERIISGWRLRFC
jgi:hypothetical protein